MLLISGAGPESAGGFSSSVGRCPSQCSKIWNEKSVFRGMIPRIVSCKQKTRSQSNGGLAGRLLEVVMVRSAVIETLTFRFSPHTAQPIEKGTETIRIIALRILSRRTIVAKINGIIP